MSPAYPPAPTLRSSDLCGVLWKRTNGGGAEQNTAEIGGTQRGQEKMEMPNTVAWRTPCEYGGTQWHMSAAELGRGIWGKGMERGELAGSLAGRPWHGKNLARRGVFSGARLCARSKSRSRLTAGDASDFNGRRRGFRAAAAGSRRTQPRSLGGGSAAPCSSRLRSPSPSPRLISCGLTLKCGLNRFY